MKTSRCVFYLWISCISAYFAFAFSGTYFGYSFIYASIGLFLYACFGKRHTFLYLSKEMLWKLRNHSAQSVSNKHWENCQNFGISYLFNEPDRFMNQIVFLNQEICSRINKQSNIADIGCADGWFSVLLGRFAASVHGYDLSPYMIKAARDRTVNSTTIQFDEFDILNDALPNSFDAVCCMGLLTYIIDEISENSVISKIYDSIIPGGGGTYS